MSSFPSFPPEIKTVLITGGAGFIGGALIRRILKDNNIKVYNLDKIGYASDLTYIERIQQRDHAFSAAAS